MAVVPIFSRSRPGWKASLSPSKLLASAFTVVAVGLAGAAGEIATINPAPLKALGAVVAACLVPILLVHLDVGAVIFLGILWARVSDIAIEFHGAPSIALPFGALLIATSFGRRLLRGEQVRWSWLRNLMVVVPYSAVLLVSAAWAVDPTTAVGRATDFLKDALLFWMIADLIRGQRALTQAALALTVAAGGLSAVGILQFVTGNFASSYGGFAQSEILNIVGTVNSERLGGPMNSPNFFALILAITVPLGLALLRTRLGIVIRLLVAGSLLATVVTILLTYSRGGVITMLAAGLLALPRHRIRPRHLVLAILACVVIAVVAPPRVWDRLNTLSTPVTGGTEQGTVVDDSVEERLGAAYVAIDMFLSRPFAGFGAGNFPIVYEDYARQTGLFYAGPDFAPHDLYLEILSETGVLGFAAFAYLTVAPLLGLRRRLSRTSQQTPDDHDLREILFGIEGAVVVYLFGSFFLHGAFIRYYLLLLALAMAASESGVWVTLPSALAGVPAAGLAAVRIRSAAPSRPPA